MDWPLYLSAEQAAEYSGIGSKTWRDWLNSKDPPPFIRIGNARKIQRDGIVPYLIGKQEVKL